MNVYNAILSKVNGKTISSDKLSESSKFVLNVSYFFEALGLFLNQNSVFAGLNLC